MEKIKVKIDKDSVALLKECYNFLNQELNKKLQSRSYFKDSYELASAVGNYLKQIEKHDTGSKNRETI